MVLSTLLLSCANENAFVFLNQQKDVDPFQSHDAFPSADEIRVNIAHALFY